MTQLHITKPLTIFVTGCSRGLGLEFVKQLLTKQKDSLVIATCREPSKAEDLQKLKEGYSKRLHVVPLDVSDEKSIEKVPHVLSKDLGISSIDWLINNAGYVDSDSMIKVYRTNVIGPILISDALIPYLTHDLSKRDYIPRIVNLSSLLGSITTFQSIKHNADASVLSAPSYRCSKAALNMLTQCIDKDLNDKIQRTYSDSKKGVIVIACSPGWVVTDMGTVGGRKPPLTSEQSIQGMLSVIENVKLDDSGKFFSFDGKTLPW
ncbi:hypothetical protein RFI_21079 [Reticulomyxa filosa]|uniref:NAD(P)-binding protein n=1 Tax=Reticulomyxa filosa TaxID=46433 RepID=X6MT41_RETFI|nr:hypothetical protein RFI_21079 [Reticulomyxa filosa]|eukprot:ETO16275.1 hypothetical protein RFI_21079 [Reticulomyxa filosa]